MGEPGTDADALFEHAGWVLTLARRLVGDAAADDITQQTMLAALRRPPAGGRPLRPWLARVARGFAHKWSRGERRRRAREQVAATAREFAVPSAAELAASAELLRELVEEVSRLDDALRTVVTLRYLHGLDATAIGERLGVPAGTVRWRLSVGIERLRARLDDRHGGDRARWAAVLAASLGTAPAPVAAAGKPALVLAAALGLLAAGGYAAWGGGSAATPDADRPLLRASAAAPTGPAPSAATAAVAATPADRVAVAEPRGEPLLAPGLAGVRVRATDELGAPLAMAELSWGSGTDSLAMTDARGEAWLRLRPPGDGVRLQFALTARGRAVRLAGAVVQVGVWSDLGTLLLPRTVAVRGRVVTPESAPVAAATVFVTAAPLAPAGNVDPLLGPAAWPMFACAPARTDGDGAFALEVPASAVCVVAVADEREFAASRPLELGQRPPGAPIEPAPIELCCPPLPPGSRVAVHVVDADGRAIPGARVCRRAATMATGDPGAIRQPRWFTADAGGRVVVPARAQIDYDLRIEAPGCAPQMLTLRRAGDDERVQLRPQ